MASEIAAQQSAHDRVPDAVSPWIARWTGLIAPRSNALDLACGYGRHSRLLAAQGHHVTAVDFDAQALAVLREVPGITTLAANLEHAPWPFTDRQFAAIIVANYLHRPLLSKLVDSLAPDGVLLYETFMHGNEHYGRPSNPDFLLAPGELLDFARDRLQVVAFEQGRVGSPRPAVVQRLCAVGRQYPWPPPLSG
jgi:SAM-dependent methyltransferase